VLNRWYSWAICSRLEPINKVARTIQRHRDGVLRWFDSKIANGLIEAINSLVQAAKAKARGYRSLRNLIAITYLSPAKSTSSWPLEAAESRFTWPTTSGFCRLSGGIFIWLGLLLAQTRDPRCPPNRIRFRRVS
jgi:hypothetical protein